MFEWHSLSIDMILGAVLGHETVNQVLLTSIGFVVLLFSGKETQLLYAIIGHSTLILGVAFHLIFCDFSSSQIRAEVIKATKKAIYFIEILPQAPLLPLSI